MYQVSRSTDSANVVLALICNTSTDDGVVESYFIADINKFASMFCLWNPARPGPMRR